MSKFFVTNQQMFVITLLSTSVIFSVTFFIVRNRLKKSIKKNDYSLLSRSSKRNFKIILDEYMRNNKPYLNPEMSLTVLAKEMAVDEKFIDDIINKSYKSSFHNYINKFRVDECINSISNMQEYEVNLEEIVFKSGFSTYDAFHFNFTKRVGMTPEAFKNKFTSISMN